MEGSQYDSRRFYYKDSMTGKQDNIVESDFDCGR